MNYDRILDRRNYKEKDQIKFHHFGKIIINIWINSFLYKYIHMSRFTAIKYHNIPKTFSIF